jgi:hypothetical protein
MCCKRYELYKVSITPLKRQIYKIDPAFSDLVEVRHKSSHHWALWVPHALTTKGTASISIGDGSAIKRALTGGVLAAFGITTLIEAHRPAKALFVIDELPRQLLQAY